MSNYSKIYWFTRLDSFSHLLILVFVLVIVYVFGVMIFCAVNTDNDGFAVRYDGEDINQRKSFRKKLRDRVRWVLPLGVFCLTLNAFIPTKNEALLIMAGGKTLDFVQSDSSLSKIPSQTTSIISSFLEKQLKEMKSSDK